MAIRALVESLIIVQIMINIHQRYKRLAKGRVFFFVLFLAAIKISIKSEKKLGREKER